MSDPEDSNRELALRKGGELIRRMDRRVELANRVVGEIRAKQDLKRLTLEVAQRFVDEPDSVDLTEYELLDDDAAEALSKLQGGCLYLFGPEELRDAAAESLSKHVVGLGLSGLKELSDAAAESLSRFEGMDLFLEGLTELSEEVAESLSDFKGHALFLEGLTELSEEVAESLSNFKGCTLFLHGLTELSDVAVESLSSFKGTLGLNGLTELSDAAAASLSEFGGEDLYLYGLTELSDSAAESLSKLPADKLNLNSLSEESRAKLEKYRDARS